MVMMCEQCQYNNLQISFPNMFLVGGSCTYHKDNWKSLLLGLLPVWVFLAGTIWWISYPISSFFNMCHQLCTLWLELYFLPQNQQPMCVWLTSINDSILRCDCSTQQWFYDIVYCYRCCCGLTKALLMYLITAQCPAILLLWLLFRRFRPPLALHGPLSLCPIMLSS